MRQQKSLIRVIIGNPPYSVAKSTAHEVLDESLEKTYVANTKATNKNSIYDSYIQAFRWASDRLAETKEVGIIAFISNGGWLDGNAMDGLRKCFRQEFSDIYVFNLRGNQRTSGELSRKEGVKIFGSGSRAGITITFLVKNPAKAFAGKYNAQIYYRDIGDYLSQKEKLALVKNLKSVSNAQMQRQQIVPNDKEDWINQRDGLFETLILIGEACQCFPLYYYTEQKTAAEEQSPLPLGLFAEEMPKQVRHDGTSTYIRKDGVTHLQLLSRKYVKILKIDFRVIYVLIGDFFMEV